MFGQRIAFGRSLKTPPENPMWAGQTPGSALVDPGNVKMFAGIVARRVRHFLKCHLPDCDSRGLPEGPALHR